MSAPHTDVEKQERRHKVPLAGMALVVAFAIVLLVVLAFYIVGRADAPEGAETQIDGTGAAEATDDAATPAEPLEESAPESEASIPEDAPAPPPEAAEVDPEPVPSGN